MDFTPTLSSNPQLRKAIEEYATNLAINELLNDMVKEHGAAGDASRHLIIGGKAINELEETVDSMVYDMVWDSFYKMLDMMRDTMKEYECYVIKAMEEAE